MALNSEIRGVAVFASYLLVACSLSTFIITAVYRRYASLTPHAAAKISKRRLGLFIVLACVSVGGTWFYMVSFFVYSYQAWLSHSHPAFLGSPEPKSLTLLARALQLVGLANVLEPEPIPRPKAFVPYSVKDTVISYDLFSAWLRDTALFRQAWESACSSLPRYWWSHQIFGVTAAWSFFLGWQGKQYAIAFAPVFMLLAQTVAVSFAMNLFFLALLVSPGPKKTASHKEQETMPPAGVRGQSAPWLVLSSNVVCVALMPFVTHTAYFMPALLIPHILLFIPTLGYGLTRKSLPPLLSASLHATFIALAVNTWILFISPDADGKTSLLTQVRIEWARQTEHAALASDEHATTTRMFVTAQSLLAPILVYLNVLERYLSLGLSALMVSIGEGFTAVLQDPASIFSGLGSLVSTFEQRERLLVTALFSHPAIASVGFDAMLCWVSLLAWVVTDESALQALVG